MVSTRAPTLVVSRNREFRGPPRVLGDLTISEVRAFRFVKLFERQDSTKPSFAASRAGYGRIQGTYT